jgi:O-antigen ligase
MKYWGTLKKTILFILLLLPWLWPVHPLLFRCFPQEVFSFVAFGLLVIFFPVRLAGGMIVPRVAGLFLLMALIPVAQYLAGEVYFFGDAFLALGYISMFALMFAYGSSLQQDREKLKSVLDLLAFSLAVAAILSAVITIRQWLGVADSVFELHKYDTRPYANMAQPNNLATLLCMGIASLLYFYESRPLRGYLISLPIGLLIVAISLTGSRTPWIASLLFLAFFSWKLHQSEAVPLKTGVRIVLLWVLLYFLMVCALPLLAEFVHLHPYHLEARATQSGRLLVWQQMLHAILQGPVWGYGWNQTSVAQVATSLAYPPDQIIDHSHNLLLDLLVWNGPIIGGAIALLLVWLVGRVFIGARRLESLYGLAVVGFVSTHAMFEYPLSYAFFLLPAGFFLGIAYGEVSFSRPLFRVPVWCVSTLLLLVIYASGVCWKEYHYLEQIRYDNALARADMAGFDRNVTAKNVYLLTQLQARVNYKVLEVGALESANLSRLEETANRYPDFHLFYKLALLLHDRGEATASLHYLELIKAMYGERDYDLSVKMMSEHKTFSTSP